MNYYERHIGDYLKDTAHLSLLEHGIYTRLMDVYYTRECGIDASDVARLIGARSKDEKAALQVVLDEFFVLVAGVYTQARCDREIERYQDKQRKAKASADARWNAQRPQSEGNANAPPDAMRTHSEGNALQSPVTSNQTPVTKRPPKSPKGESEGFEEFYAAYPRKEDRAKAVKAFAKVTAPLADLLAALDWQTKSSNWRKDGGQFIPLPASWLNGERWKDEKPSMPQPGDAPAWFETRQGVERKAHALGIGPWVELEEQYPTYRARVMTAAKEQGKSFGLNLDQLAAMAAEGRIKTPATNHAN